MKSLQLDVNKGKRRLQAAGRTSAEGLGSGSGYRSVLERCREGIFLCTPSGKLIDANRALVEMLGYTTKEELFRAQEGGCLTIARSQFSTRNNGTVYVKISGDGPVLYLEADAWVVSGPGEELYYGGIVRNDTRPAELSYKPVHSVSAKKTDGGLMEHLAVRDPLTGLYNRTYFERELRKLENTCFPVSLILLDIDGLKIINDTMGYESGNQMLCAAASVIQSCVPRDALVARVDGDEFAVLLNNYPCESAKKICASIYTRVQKFNRGLQKSLPLSISTGYSVREATGVGMEELLRQADNIMFREKLHSKRSSRSSIVGVLKKTLEFRDPITGSHSERIKHLAVAIGKELKVPDQMVSDLKLLAQFHDIGKVGIADRILFKPGPLTRAEFKEMQRHCEIGYRIALSSPDLAQIADLILKHHEWWNGQGYPLGLKEKDIPLECRILALADAYDSMTTDRPYRKAVTKEAAIEELEAFSGKQFDPEVFESFLGIIAGL